MESNHRPHDIPNENPFLQSHALPLSYQEPQKGRGAGRVPVYWNKKRKKRRSMGVSEEAIVKRLCMKSVREVFWSTWVHPEMETFILPDETHFLIFLRKRIEEFSREEENKGIEGLEREKESICGVIVTCKWVTRVLLLFVDEALKVSIFKLDMGKCPEYSIFNGQVVRVFGKMEKEVFFAEEIQYVNEVSVPLPDGKRKQAYTLSLFNMGRSKESMSVESVLDLVREQESDVTIMIADLSIRDRKTCQIWAKREKRVIICIPERDGIYGNMVYPIKYLEPSTERKVQEKSESAYEVDLSNEWYTELCNPCFVTINGVSIGISSYDALWSIATSEVSKNISVQRMDRLVGQMHLQGCFAPAALRETPINYLAYTHLLWPYIPHCLFIDTKLELPMNSFELGEVHSISKMLSKYSLRFVEEAQKVQIELLE
ncbi:hypothetical protein NEFER03_1521 [Nematocida sp. LUAm3]|nr:hypothetical protein NEFER03_1521 [Nematocida sp. LUAm3]KAI5174554.1 hypothetical protein NEFER02_0675 [Nematocida sp. LUAm2]KAI5178040.1 hypothetical protein NEFER01_1222 [Nematocida sp. LUAm1]